MFHLKVDTTVTSACNISKTCNNGCQDQLVGQANRVTTLSPSLVDVRGNDGRDKAISVQHLEPL